MKIQNKEENEEDLKTPFIKTLLCFVSLLLCLKDKVFISKAMSSDLIRSMGSKDGQQVIKTIHLFFSSDALSIKSISSMDPLIVVSD